MEQKQEGLEGRMEGGKEKEEDVVREVEELFNRLTEVDIFAPWRNGIKKLSPKGRRFSWKFWGGLALPLLYATALGVKNGTEIIYESSSPPYVYIRESFEKQVINKKRTFFKGEHSKQIWRGFWPNTSFSSDGALEFQIVFDPEIPVTSADFSLNGKLLFRYKCNFGTRHLHREDKPHNDFYNGKYTLYELVKASLEDKSLEGIGEQPVYFVKPTVRLDGLYDVALSLDTSKMHSGENELHVDYTEKAGEKKSLEYAFTLKEPNSKANSGMLQEDKRFSKRVVDHYWDKETPRQREARGEGNGK